MTCTLWINFFDGAQASDLLVRFDDRESANYFAHDLFSMHAQNIKKPTLEELALTRENAAGVVRSDFSVWNAQAIYNPHLPDYDCTQRYRGSGIYVYDYPIDRMRDWSAEKRVSGDGYFWLALIKGATFSANVYLADNGFVPVQKYLADSVLQEITNYKKVTWVEEEEAVNMLL